MLRRPPRSTRTDHTLSLHDALPIYGDHPFFGTGQAEAPPMPRHWRRLPGASRVRTGVARPSNPVAGRSEEHTSELQSLMRISYAVFCLKKKTKMYTTYEDVTASQTD